MAEGGIHVGLQTANSAAETLLPFRFALERGFEVFEWFPDRKLTSGWELADLSPALRKEIRAAGLAYTVHAPWGASVFTAEGQTRLVESLDFAREIGAALLNVHLALESGAEAFAAAMVDLIRAAASAGVVLSLENTPEDGPEACNAAFAAIRRLPLETSHVGLCLDVGHANLCATTRNDYVRFVDSLAPDLPIVHVHLHENYGDADSHLLVFTGPSRDDDLGIRLLLERLVRRRYGGAIILEQWPNPPELLVAARRRLEQLLAAHRPPPAPPVVPESGDLAQRIAVMHATRTSWRRRLEWVRDVVTAPGFAGAADELATLAIYLRWLATGALACEEDGGHHRPSRHAQLALEIEAALLARVVPETLALVRSIVRCLPSHDASFRSSEPLTRIRDIAHRNDIPKDLKLEIKHALQNKLHRSAGPEDLETSRRILQRITAPDADYAHAFVEQFQIFHAELEEFFNAGSLEDDLVAVADSAEPPLVAAISELMAQRERGERSGKGLDRLLVTTLRVRKALEPAFATAGGAVTQRRRIADIKLEELTFVTLSERINQFEASAPSLPWDSLLRILVVAVKSVALAGASAEECAAVERELSDCRTGFGPGDPEGLLRLRAALERTRNLAAGVTDAVLALLTPRVQRLGELLGLSGAQVRFFCEGDIRRSVAFQLSKLATLALLGVRGLAKLPPWDAVVAGSATGTLLELDRLDALPEAGGPCVVLLGRAEGDEELPARVRGIVLAHDIPHLSHLGVRARQNRVPFATVASDAVWNELCAQVGAPVVLHVSSGRVELAPCAAAPPEVAPARVSVPALELRLARALEVVPLAQAEVATCGPKATAARRLRELALREDAGFGAAAGCVVPFGVMELCRGTDGTWLEDAVARVAALVEASLPGPGPWFVRSSASGEDLPGYAAAGRYVSVGGVTRSDLPRALRAVWGSLHGPRAVHSRREAGIPESAIRMAVLVQEALDAELSFVIHSTDPLSADPLEGRAELAVGLGETLASASEPGSPYRLVFHRETGAGRWTALGSFSRARRLAPGGGLRMETVDYGDIALTTSRAARDDMALRLSGVARVLQEAFGGPQDVEGAQVGGRLYVVQTRPQPAV